MLILCLHFGLSVLLILPMWWINVLDTFVHHMGRIKRTEEQTDRQTDRQKYIYINVSNTPEMLNCGWLHRRRSLLPWSVTKVSAISEFRLTTTTRRSTWPEPEISPAHDYVITRVQRDLNLQRRLLSSARRHRGRKLLLLYIEMQTYVRLSRTRARFW